jgi:putative PEP-CTERM system TPR-repeat lipoprotein
VLSALIVGCSRDPQARKQAYFESGTTYLDKGDYRAAVIEFRNAVNIDPLFGPARAKLADSYARLGDGANALAEYVRAADLLKDDYDVQLRAAALLLAADRGDEALAKADLALKLRPSAVPAHIMRGNALARLNSFDEALKAIEEAVRLDPARGETFTQKGIIQLASGRRDEAEAAFTKAVSLDPKAIDGYLALGNYYWAVGRAPETERAFAAALKIRPDDAGANRAMAAFLLAVGKTADAEQYLRAVAEKSGDTSSIYALTDYYVLAGRSKEAIDRLTPLASSEAPAPGSRERLARAYSSGGDRVKAREVVDSILKSDKTNLEARLLSAQFLFDEGKRDEALATVRDAANTHPNSVEAQFILGRIYASRGDSTAAEAAFREVLRLNPRMTGAHLELSRLQLQNGKPSEALSMAGEAVRNDPDNVTARLTLIRSQLASKDVAGAEREIAALKAKYPNLGAVHAQAGMLAALKTDFAGARASFERALVLEGDSIEALTGLIMLEVRAGDLAAAKRHIDSRVNGKPSPEMLMLAARTYATANDLGATETFLRRAIEADSTMLPAYAMLGQLYLSQKKLDEARKEFESMAARQSKPVAALTMSGIILQTQGNTAEARKRYEQVLSIDGRAPIAANNLAWLQAEAGDNLDVALQIAQTAAAAAPQLPDVADTVGWIYYKKKLPALAIQQFQRSIELAPAGAIYHYHLGLAYQQRGETARGRQALQKALSLNPDATLAANIKRVLGES